MSYWVDGACLLRGFSDEALNYGIAVHLARGGRLVPDATRDLWALCWKAERFLLSPTQRGVLSLDEPLREGSRVTYGALLADGGVSERRHGEGWSFVGGSDREPHAWEVAAEERRAAASRCEPSRCVQVYVGRRGATVHPCH